MGIPKARCVVDGMNSVVSNQISAGIFEFGTMFQRLRSSEEQAVSKKPNFVRLV